MLDGIRKATQGGIGRFIMGVVLIVIIISFAIWGVGDMFRGFTSDKVAEVGSSTITAREYQTELQNLIYYYQRRSKTPFTTAEAHAMGLDAQLLERMIDEGALDAAAKSLGLGMSSQTIADAVRDDPKLKGADGQFSRDMFDQALRDFGPQRARLLRQAARHLSAPAARVRAGRRPDAAQGAGRSPRRRRRGDTHDRLFRAARERRRRHCRPLRRRPENLVRRAQGEFPRARRCALSTSCW